MRENGYEGMPPVQEMTTSLSLCGETSSLKAPESRLNLSPWISLKWQGIYSSWSDRRFVAH